MVSEGGLLLAVEMRRERGHHEVGLKRGSDSSLDGFFLDGRAGSGADDACGVLALLVEQGTQRPRDRAQRQQTGHLLTRIVQVHPEGSSVHVV
jgi:cytochrome c peroxidase